MEIVAQRRADTKELRIGDNADVDVEAPRREVFLDPGAHPCVAAHRNRALGHQDAICVGDASDFVGDVFQGCHVRAPVRSLGGSDTKEHDLRARDPFCQVVGERQSVRSYLAGYHLVEARLEEGSAAASKRIELVTIGFHCRDVVPDECERRGDHSADVTAPDDADVGDQFCLPQCGDLIGTPGAVLRRIVRATFRQTVSFRQPGCAADC